MKWENCEASDLIYIGDNPNKDFINIKKIGIRTIRVLTGGFKEIFLENHFEAEITIKSLDQLNINLINELSNKTKDFVACVGFVNLYMKDDKFNYLKLYQFAEYYIAQLLRRNFQSIYTNKVNCLSGCNQLIIICEETCGDELLYIFNKKPTNDDNIFKHI
jgi:ribonucleotide monophosphatase NagD (HAD superfamily)